MGIIEDVKTILEELERQQRFLERFLDFASRDEWKAIDPDLTVAKQVYSDTKTKIIDKANELPTV